MARIRTIKPEFWRNEALSELPEGTHMLAAALLNYADDEGYFNANPKLIQGELFPLRDLSVTIHGALTELSRAGYLRLGTGDDGRRYGHIIKFLEHQVINRPKASKVKGLSIVWEASVIDHGSISDPSRPEWNREQGKELEKEHESTDAYKGRFVKRVTEKSMQELQAMCPLMTRSDILKELSRCDAYYSEQDKPPKSWWFTTTAWMERSNNRLSAKSERYSTKTDPAYRGVL